MIYLIEKAWKNEWENDACNAFGFEPFAYVKDEEEAKKICEESRTIDKLYCWVLINPVKEMRYKPVEEFTNDR